MVELLKTPESRKEIVYLEQVQKNLAIMLRILFNSSRSGSKLIYKQNTFFIYLSFIE